MTFINEAAREFEMAEPVSMIDGAIMTAAQFRGKVIRECIHTLVAGEPSDSSIDCVRALQAMISETIETPEPPFTLCERTVKMCLQMAWDAAAELEQHDRPLFLAISERIESLIPKDRAAELVEEYRAFLNLDFPGSADDMRLAEEAGFARWLDGRGLIKW